MADTPTPIPARMAHQKAATIKTEIPASHEMKEGPSTETQTQRMAAGKKSKMNCRILLIII